MLGAPAGRQGLMDVLDSQLMQIVIVGSTVRYAYRTTPARSYEIRAVSDLDLARLRRTAHCRQYSSSATVQLLTHRYRDSHFRSDGTPAEPCCISEAQLLPRTPFGR